MTYLEMMEHEIRIAGKPLTIREAISNAETDGTILQVENKGKTPQNTINALLHKDIARGDNARFVQTSTKPARFDIRKE